MWSVGGIDRGQNWNNAEITDVTDLTRPDHWTFKKPEVIDHLWHCRAIFILTSMSHTACISCSPSLPTGTHMWTQNTGQDGPLCSGGGASAVGRNEYHISAEGGDACRRLLEGKSALWGSNVLIKDESKKLVSQGGVLQVSKYEKKGFSKYFMM